MAMRWHDVLFLHWPVVPELIRPLIPPDLELDSFEGQAWISIVSLRLTRVRPRYVPGIAGLAFSEIDVRTYVWSPDRSGVWFFSLDATNRLAVRTARTKYRLPYHDARITIQTEGGGIHYQSSRLEEEGSQAEFDALCKPTGAVYRSALGTNERWLTDRYCLYTVDDHGHSAYAEIHHAPWPLQTAEVELRVNTITAPLGIELPALPPLAHFARGLEVVAWPLVPVAG
jgi:uncharacterized protein YqjF (DUF2071 family)